MTGHTAQHPGGESDNFIHMKEMYRNKLNVSTFAGVGDVEQFIEEFTGVSVVTQWPPRVALIKLWEALTEHARPFRQRRSITEIFTALRSRFGISALEAKARLQVLLRTDDTPLRDHATLVQRLARRAYSDLPEEHQRSYTLTDFIQSLNDMGLHHQLQARGVITLEDALQVEEDYLRARRLYTKETEGTRVTTKAVQSLGDEMDWLSNLLKQVAKTPIRVQIPHRGSKGEIPTTATLCGNNKTPRHLYSKCPQHKRPPHFRKPRKAPRPRGPGKEQPWDGYRRVSKRTPRDTPPL